MSIRNYMERFFLLSWKLYKTQWNRKLELLWMLASPIILCSVLVIMRLQVDPTPRLDIMWTPVDLERSWSDMTDSLRSRTEVALTHDKSYSVFVPQLVIAWAPTNYNIFENIINLSSYDLKPMKFKRYPDCPSVEKSLLAHYYFAGICFDPTNFERNYSIIKNRLAEDERTIPHFNYTIVVPSELRIVRDHWIGDNWHTIYNDDPRMTIIQRLHVKTNDGRSSYIREGLINVQKAITESYLKTVTRKNIPKILIRRFPVDYRSEDPLMTYVSRALPLFLVVGFMFPSQILVYQIVKEKQNTLRSFLINMNIGNIIHFTVWFCKGMCISLFSTVIIMFILKIRWNDGHSVLTQTPWHVVLLVLASYNVATISFVLMFSSFFKNGYFALRTLTIVWLLSYMPFFMLWNNREKVMKFMRYLSCVLPNTVLALMCESLIEQEVIFSKEWKETGYTLSYDMSRITTYTGIFIFMIMALVYSFVAIYMDVWNRESGGRRRQNIPAPTQSGDFTYQDRDESMLPQGTQSTTGRTVRATKIYEVEPSHRRFKIRIKKLFKRYSNSIKPALNSFTFNIYENEVTVLMGHNGCGKTTLLRILAGLEEPTRGVVMVSDFNILTERHEATLQLGLALNDDLLLGDLTVADQIRFISLAKGSSWSVAAEEIDTYTGNLNISHLKHHKVSSLSTQERNLLNFCCAFAGGSPIVLIDEIHSELDLKAQSLICGLINEEKSRRTIILVSNSTEFASHLADRLAIMSNGELKCTGTRPFLRNMYGHGYRLTCVKGKAFDFIGLSQLLSRYVPNLTVESNIGYKVTFVLENKYEEKFPDLFDDLENMMERLDVISFRLRDTSLEEIFLRFGSEEGELTPDPNILVEDLKLALDDLENCTRMKGRKLIFRQFDALIYLHWTANKRQLPITIINWIAVILALGFAYSTVLIYGKDFELVPLSFNLTQLPHIHSFVEAMAKTEDVIEMQELFTELVFWYDGHVKILQNSDNPGYYLLNNKDFSRDVHYRYMFGASLKTEEITVWFNTIPLHSLPFALNLVHNVIARRFFDETASIDVTLNPLPFKNAVNAFPQTPMTLGSMVAINLGFILGTIWAGVMMFDIRCPEFKKLHYLCGIGVYTDVFATIFFELVRVIFKTTCCTLIISIFMTPRHDMSLYMRVFGLVILVGSSTVILSHFLYAVTRDVKGVFIVVTMFNVVGIVMFTVVVGDSLTNMDDRLQTLFFTFGEVMFKLFILYDYKWLCLDKDVRFMSEKVLKCNCTPNCCIEHDYWEKGIYGSYFDIFILTALNVIPISLLFFIEINTVMGCSYLTKFKQKLNKLIYRPKTRRAHNSTIIVPDESVITQRQLVDEIVKENRCADMAVVCQRLAKNFGNKHVLVQIDMCIEKSECIALLGNNNTGKTTLVKLLIGDLIPSQGNIWIGGYSMETERGRCYPLMGYCNQRVRFPYNFTPRELLLTQAQMRGLSDKCSELYCEALATILGFNNSYKQLVQQCTTGQLRRVAFALAILGNPLVVCIDGPPGGIDPNGKRVLYSLTAFMQQRGCSMFFTNMNEWDGERMCQRTPFLYEGRLWTMGTKDERYRRGYLLEVRFKRKVNADVGSTRVTWERINKVPVSPHSKLVIFVGIKFPDAVIFHQDDYTIAFYIPPNATTFSDIFLIIRKDAFELNIEDFYITRNVDYFGRSPFKGAKPTN